MSKLNVTRISELKTEKARSDKKVSRQFYTIYVADVANPFTSVAQRTLFQNHSQDGKTAFWKGADYNQAKALIGKEIEGEITRLEVKPYDIDGRMASSYTCVVLKGEDAATIAKAAGHELSGAIVSQLQKETV